MKKSALFTLLVSSWLIIGSVAAVDAQTYDVEVILNRMKCLKVVEAPFDSEEDIYGIIAMAAYKMVDAAGAEKKEGCCAFGLPCGAYHFEFVRRTSYLNLGQNESKLFNTSKKFSGLTLNQVNSLEFALGGFLKDNESLMPPIGTISYQECNECGIPQSGKGCFEPIAGIGSPTNAAFRLVKMSSYASQLSGMSVGSSKFIRVGSDNIMELNFYEGDTNSSHIQCQFNIKVTRKS